jgi:hypothetical protein
MSKWRLMNALTMAGMLLVNALANTLPLNGKNTGEISDSYPVLFTPAGYVFSIWGLIYLALIGFSVYQALPAQMNHPRINRIGGWFTLANVLNIAWLFAWHWEVLWLSVVLMLGLLACLLIIYTRLEIGLHARISSLEQALVDFPFSLYLGWISVATIANVSAALFDSNWNGFGLAPQVWAIIMIGVTAILGLLMISRRNALTYPVVLIWALLGIRLRPDQIEPVGTVAAAAAFILLLYLTFRLLRARQLEMLRARGTRPTD